jgi:hypothetical protein
LFTSGELAVHETFPRTNPDRPDSYGCIVGLRDHGRSVAAVMLLVCPTHCEAWFRKNHDSVDQYPGRVREIDSRTWQVPSIHGTRMLGKGGLDLSVDISADDVPGVDFDAASLELARRAIRRLGSS